MRQRLLQIGVAGFTENGFLAVTVDAIVAKAKVSKATFYYYFASKTEFGLELIEAYDQCFKNLLSKFFDEAALNPVERLSAFMKDAETRMAENDFRQGGLISNLGQELGSLPERLRDRLVEALSDWQRMTVDLFEAAQNANAIKAELDVHALASFFWIGWEGAVMHAKLQGTPSAIQCFSDHFFKLILNTRSETHDV